jgi:hypothetical protein
MAAGAALAVVPESAQRLAERLVEDFPKSLVTLAPAPDGLLR